MNCTPDQIRRMELRLSEMKHEVKSSINDCTLTKRKKLRSRLLHADPTRRKFWRFVKHMVENSSNITALYDEHDNMVFNVEEIEDVILHHFNSRFAGQREPPITDKAYLNDHTDIVRGEMEQIIANDRDFDSKQFEDEVCKPYTFPELDEALSNLPNGKSAGYDSIPNELLKNSGPRFKLYLHEFLNRILETGHVPEDLNAGKCILIFKVDRPP